MSKARLALTFILIALVAVAALPTMAQDGGSITMWASYDLTDEENAPSVTLAETIAAFEAETGITVEYEQVAWDQIPTKLALQARSGGDMPDVVEAASQHVIPLITTGALMDISDMVAETDWIDTLNPSEAQACVVGDLRFCVAADIRGGAWYYNDADFPDGWPTTAEGWMEEGARLAEEDTYVATFFAGRHYGAVELTWGPLFYSAGGSLFDEEGLPDWASEENAAVVDWMREMLANGYIPETAFTGDFTAGETPWVDGNAAAVRGGSWSYLFIPGLQDKYEAGETSLGLAPSFNGGPNYVFLVGEGWAVAREAENPEGAMAWIDFFMNEETLAAWASNHFGIPTIDAAFNNEVFEGEFYQAVAENLANNGVFIEPSLCYVEALTKLSETLQELMLDSDLDVMDALTDSQDQIRRSCGQK